MGAWGPELVKGVNEVVGNYPGQRGIIPTHNIQHPGTSSRTAAPESEGQVLFQPDFRDKGEMLKEHARRSDTVLVAPAMHGGSI
jgi:hypothetical protein